LPKVTHFYCLTNLVEHTINTGDHRPVHQRPRRIPLAKIKEAEEAIQNMVKQEVIGQFMSNEIS
jgi:hypothetical protein